MFYDAWSERAPQAAAALDGLWATIKTGLGDVAAGLGPAEAGVKSWADSWTLALGGTTKGMADWLNMGPQHPSTHGVLRLIVELDGENVVRVAPDVGYLHSGFEKSGESKRYKDFVFYTDRMDYASAMQNNLAYCVAVERMLDIEIPARAQVIRVIMAELQRIASHLLWLVMSLVKMAHFFILLPVLSEQKIEPLKKYAKN